MIMLSLSKPVICLDGAMGRWGSEGAMPTPTQTSEAKTGMCASYTHSHKKIQNAACVNKDMQMAG